jgi:hypothetical protein
MSTSYLAETFTLSYSVTSQFYQVNLNKESESLVFWTLSIFRYSKTRKLDVSEAGSVSVLRYGKGDKGCNEI